MCSGEDYQVCMWVCVSVSVYVCPGEDYQVCVCVCVSI